MFASIFDLQEFYASPLGAIAARHLKARIRDFWPDLSRERVLCIGYPVPYMRSILSSARSCHIFMPAHQGVMRYPEQGANWVVAGDEAALPFDEGSFDRILLIHGLEGADHRPSMLLEIWRVLTAGGKVLSIVPNRQGVWSRVSHTPFAVGYPYFVWQLKKELNDHGLVPSRVDSALFFPPMKRKIFLRSASFWEKIGRQFFAAFSGVHIVEATKQVYAIPKPKKLTFPQNILMPAPSKTGLARGARQGHSLKTQFVVKR